MCPIRYRGLYKHTMPNQEVIKLWRLEKSYISFSKASLELGNILRGSAIIFCFLDLFYLLLDKVLARAAYY
jgi:hypothetical protein